MDWQTPERFYFSAAQGWLELGNPAEAQAELNQLPVPLRGHPDVLRLQIEIFAEAKQWEACANTAALLLRLTPDDPFPYIRRAFALHELRRTQDAHDTLTAVASRFPSEWVIPYNLACYCAQLGQIDVGMEWLIIATNRNRAAVRDAAVDDLDLVPLHSLPQWTELQRSLKS
jgi:predicted Zn-dependent protease